jgi:hypothetical protein
MFSYIKLNELIVENLINQKRKYTAHSTYTAHNIKKFVST